MAAKWRLSVAPTWPCRLRALLDTEVCAIPLLVLSWAPQVREYSKAEEVEQAEGSAGAQGLREEANAKRRQLEQWSASAYGEVCVPISAAARHFPATSLWQG